jgi:hypothetical protein
MRNRIPPEMVKQAFDTLHYEPIQNSWASVRHKDGVPCACGLSAVAVSCGADYQELCELDEPEYLIGSTLDVSQEYISGYTRGFDGEPNIACSQGDDLLGYQDGAAAAQLLDL